MLPSNDPSFSEVGYLVYNPDTKQVGVIKGTMLGVANRASIWWVASNVHEMVEKEELDYLKKALHIFRESC